MKQLLATLLVALMTTLSMSSCASAPKYHMFDGPPRLEMSIPKMVRTGQRFIMKARMLGENGQLPFDQYITVVVKANDVALGQSTFILTDRNVTGAIMFSPDFYNTFMARGGRMETPMDYIDSVPQPMPIEGIDEFETDLKVTVEMEVWLSEPNFKNEMIMVKRILHKKATTKLSCVHQSCLAGMY